MVTPIDETIAVGGIYERGAFSPRVFRWKGQKYTVEHVTLISDLRDGSVRKRVYSVLVNEVLYRLCFDRDHEEWKLLAIAT